jgi:hypothetical protein
MNTPGFTAEISLYRTSANYFELPSGSDRVGDGVLNTNWKIPLLRDVIYLNGLGGIPVFGLCGSLGKACCRAPIQDLAADGPLVSCDKGLGCDITTNRCVASCGQPGQVCCDGPETRAPKWTASGAVYSPNFWNMREMCQQGACDKQTHRCFVCGTQDSSPCCPPDAAQATARCFGEKLYCQYDPQGFDVSGTCRTCGQQGRLPCGTGCDPGLGIRNGLCELCGSDSQLPCDAGCNPGLGMKSGLCRLCGGVGQVPCDNGCAGGLALRNGLCSMCGAAGQSACDSGCRSGTRLVNGICVACGYTNQVPCSSGCVYPLKVAGGICRTCGGNGQIPCDAGCNQGLAIKNGLCSTNQATTPENCSSIGESCVPDSQQGIHCCQNPGAPELCVYEKCHACIPHGAEVPAGGTQICCDAKDGDQVVLDQASGRWVCGIPG